MKPKKILFALSILLVAALGSNPVFADPVVITGDVEIPPGPEYLHRAVFYQIYPQTFFDSDADGIDDLPGISDYYKVATRYGTNEDARRMFAEADKRGLKILFDWVIGYTSIDHPWFQASARQEPNKYSNWYIWTDNTWIDPPPAFRASFIKGSDPFFYRKQRPRPTPGTCSWSRRRPSHTRSAARRKARSSVPAGPGGPGWCRKSRRRG